MAPRISLSTLSIGQAAALLSGGVSNNLVAAVDFIVSCH